MRMNVKCFAALLALALGVGFGIGQVCEMRTVAAVSPAVIEMAVQSSQGAMSAAHFETYQELEARWRTVHLRDVNLIVDARDSIKTMAANGVANLAAMPGKTAADMSSIAALAAAYPDHQGAAMLQESVDDTVVLFTSVVPFFDSVDEVANPE